MSVSLCIRPYACLTVGVFGAKNDYRFQEFVFVSVIR